MADVNIDVAMESTSQEILTAVNNMEAGFAGELTVSVIKSIQRGTISIGGSDTSGTATINSVSINKSAVFHNGNYATETGKDGDGYTCTVELTNSTTVTARKVQTTNSVGQVIAFTVIEYC